MLDHLALVGPTQVFTGFRLGYLLRTLPSLIHPNEARARALGLLLSDTGRSSAGAGGSGGLEALGPFVRLSRVLAPLSPGQIVRTEAAESKCRPHPHVDGLGGTPACTKSRMPQECSVTA